MLRRRRARSRPKCRLLHLVRRIYALTREAKIKKEVAAYLQDVGAAVRRVREERGRTQLELACQAGIARRTLIEVEGGAGGTLETLGRLCYALDCAPERLCLPRGLLGQVTRNVCEAVGLDLLSSKRRRAPAGRLPLVTEITGRPVPARKRGGR